jgi:hypothetical protein
MDLSKFIQDVQRFHKQYVKPNKDWSKQTFRKIFKLDPDHNDDALRTSYQQLMIKYNPTIFNILAQQIDEINETIDYHYCAFHYHKSLKE